LPLFPVLAPKLFPPPIPKLSLNKWEYPREIPKTLFAPPIGLNPVSKTSPLSLKRERRDSP